MLVKKSQFLWARSFKPISQFAKYPIIKIANFSSHSHKPSLLNMRISFAFVNLPITSKYYSTPLPTSI